MPPPINKHDTLLWNAYPQIYNFLQNHGRSHKNIFQPVLSV